MSIHSAEHLRNDFDVLDAVLKGRDRVQAKTSKGVVYISKVSAGFIKVAVFEESGVQTDFEVYPDGNVLADAKKPAQVLHGYEGGGTIQHEYLAPRFSLDSIMLEIERSARCTNLQVTDYRQSR